MKPQLVDLNRIFEDHSSIFKTESNVGRKIPPQKDKIKVYTPFNYNSLFNLIGLIILIIGIYFLHGRKKEKEERRNGFEKRIHKLKDIIKSNDEFIL